MWIGMEMTLKKTIEYPLPAMYTSETQWEAINREIRRVYLPKSGFNRNLPRVILYGPTNRLGLGRPSIVTTQGATHIEELSRGETKGKEVQFRLEAAIEWIAMEIRSTSHITELKWERVR